MFQSEATMTDPTNEPSRLEAIATRWTELQAAHLGSTTTGGEARKTLVLRYQPAIRRYIGAMVQDQQDAEDLSQDVMVRLLQGDFSGADPARGRFRDLLKVAVRNMVRNHWARSKRRKTVDFDVAGVDVPEEDADDGPWLVAWRRRVLDLAWNALKQRERERAGNVDYTLLRLRTEHPDDSSQQLADRLSEQLGKPFRADAVRQKLRRARLQFVDSLLAEVANGFEDPTPEMIEDELVSLGLMDLLRDLLPDDWKGG